MVLRQSASIEKDQEKEKNTISRNQPKHKQKGTPATKYLTNDTQSKPTR